MHVRVRLLGQPEEMVVVESKLTKIEKFRRILKEKYDVAPSLQRLFYGGKLLEDGYTFHDYNIKINDVIQVMVQPKKVDKDDKSKAKTNVDLKEKNNETKYTDAESVLYAVGDLIDMRDREQGAWFEGKIVRIVHDPHTILPNIKNGSNETYTECDEVEETTDKENRAMSPAVVSNGVSKSKKTITKCFSKTQKHKKNLKDDSLKENNIKITDTNLLYVVHLEEDDSDYFCKLSEIRPRARTAVDVKDLKVGQKVMVNYNTEDPREKGYWYDFKICEINKLRTVYELVGTIYLGPVAVPQNETKVPVKDKIYTIADLVPLSHRTEEYQKMMITAPEKRSRPLNCLTCRDDEEAQCKDCGCFLCSGKESPEKIILCDECNNGFHMSCLSPPLAAIPDEDWYCPSCRRDPNDVIAPGASKQIKKASTKSNRDWGRGMACVGKTKTCAMPANHFGPIPGIEVGMCWRFRIQLSESGVHRPPVSGIHGRDVEGAYSIVLSGGYEDDVDNGYEFTYTGSGGRDLSGNKRTAEQSCDQTLTRENKALARNCAVKQISESGGDAGDDWRCGKPVRVVRSYKMQKHFPKYAPKEGIRYDGIYKVVKYYPEKGLSGFTVWKYLLRRDDPSPAPWEPAAKQYPIVYPDGYLEAEALKKAEKEKAGKGAKGVKKRSKSDLRASDAESDTEQQPTKKIKINEESGKKTKETATKIDSSSKKKQKIENKDEESEKKLDASEMKQQSEKRIKSSENSNEGSVKKNKQAKKSPLKSPKALKDDSQPLISDMFKAGLKSSSTKKPKTESVLSEEELKAIKADKLNEKLWAECLEISESKGKKEFVEHVTEVFLCIICQDVAVSPLTTPCLHNFCMGCLKQAFKVSGRTCPCCRHSLASYQPEPNEHLKAALRTILPGYDAGKK